MVAVIEYLVSVATIGVIFSISALGLNLRYGWTGDLDLAYYLFVAIGAYTYSVLALPPAHLPPPPNRTLSHSSQTASGRRSGAVAELDVRSLYR